MKKTKWVAAIAAGIALAIGLNAWSLTRQEFANWPHGRANAIIEDEASAVTVAGTGLTTVATIKNPDKRRLGLHFDVSGQNVDDFEVYGRANASGQLQTFTPSSWAALPSGGRFRATARHTTSTGAFVDGNLDAVTTLQNGYLEMDVDGLVEIVVKASAASDSAAVTVRWSLQ